MAHITLLALGLLPSLLHAVPTEGSACTGRENLLAIRGKWTTRQDVGRSTAIPASLASELTIRVDRIGQLFRTAYPEPRGMEAAGYRDLDGPQLVQNGPYAYSYRSLYQGWYCNSNVHRLMLGTETATWAYAFVNQLTWFADPLKTLRVEGQPAFLLTRRSGTFRGIAAYEGIHNKSSNAGQTFSRAILVSRPGRSPLKPVTRRQFLEAYIASVEEQAAPMIARIENSPLDSDKKAAAVQQRREQISNLQSAARARLARMSPGEAEQPAFLSPENVVHFKDFTPEGQGGLALMRLDQTYLDARLPRYAPQFVVVYWRWQKTVPSESFRTEFEQRFDLTPLTRLLDH